MRVLCIFLTLIGTAFSVHFAIPYKSTPNYCILLDANITGTVNYWDRYLNKTQTYKFFVNTTANATGDCLDGTHPNQTTESITIDFVPNDIPLKDLDYPWNLTIIFGNDSTKSFKIIDYKLDVQFYADYFNASTNNATFKKIDGAELEWSAGEAHNGFSCSKNTLGFDNETTVDFANLKVLAFANTKNNTFQDGQKFEQCKLDIRTSDLVPIIVGACLAGLVVIVLIAYLIGRARAKRQGYASV